MSEILRRVVTLVLAGDYLVSSHGFDELAKDGILPHDAVVGVFAGIAVEDYPRRSRGSSVLVLQSDRHGRAIHVLWGIPSGQRRPAIVVTAYRPDPSRWDSELRRRIR